MQDLNDLYYFAAVVDHGGFSSAGRALGIQKSRLSRRVLLLERLGVRLLNRSSRRFSLTEIGREFYERCLAVLVEAEAAEQIVAEVRAEPRGVVRMSCPTALLSFQFGELAARFMACSSLRWVCRGGSSVLRAGENYLLKDKHEAGSIKAAKTGARVRTYAHESTAQIGSLRLGSTTWPD